MHADVFSMGKLHKDLATTMVECAQDDSKPDQQVIKVRSVLVQFNVTFKLLIVDTHFLQYCAGRCVIHAGHFCKAM